MSYDVYVINLDKRADRYKRITDNINNFSKLLNVKRFSAISAENSGTNYAPWIYCSLSHLSLIELAKEQNLDQIIVMEDDNQIVSEIFDEVLSRILKLPNWEVFNGNPTFLNRNVDSIKCVFPCPVVVSYAYGKTTNFMIYRRSSYDKLLLLKQWYIDLINDVYICNRPYNLNYEMHAFDTLICNHQLNISFITVYPYLSTQYTDYSDIDGNVVDYNKCISDFGYNIIKLVLHDKYVSCKIIGGLGNQLFILATAFAIAFKNNCYLTCELVNHIKCQFREVNEYWDTLFKFMNFSNELIKYNGYEQYFKESESEWGKYIEINKTQNKLFIEGYFQHAQYFDQYRHELSIFLGFDTFFHLYKTPINYLEKYNWLLNNYNYYLIAIHVRRGDYLKLQHFFKIPPITYFNKCLADIKLKKQYSDISKPIKFIIFSDDIPWCKTHITSNPNNTETTNIDNGNKTNNDLIDVAKDEKLQTDLLVGNPEFIYIENELDYIEMILLSYCDCFILSNSTFSWWGAYLSNKPKKAVYLPGQWFNSPNMINVYPDGLLLPSWRKITY